MLPVTLTFDSFLPRLIQSGVCVTLCHFFFFAVGKSWQIVSAKCQFSRWQGKRRGDTVSARAASSPLGSHWRPLWGFSKSPQTVMEISSTACRRTRLPFSGVNVTSDCPLLANDDLWSSLKRSTVGDANLQTSTSGAAADLSRCWSATQWLDFFTAAGWS